MNYWDVVRFAAGGLAGHNVRTGLSLLGVAIGVASVITLTSLGEGARLFVTGEFASLGSNLIIVVPGKTETAGATPFISQSTSDLTVSDGEALQRQLHTVRRVAPVALGNVSASFGQHDRRVIVIGTTHELLDVRKLHVRVGRYLLAGERDAPVCVIGATIRRELFLDENPLGRILRVGENRLRVVGVMKSRGTSIGMNLDEVIHVPVDTAMRMFNQTSLFRLLVEVSSHEDIAVARDRAVALLTERHDMQEDITVLTQDAVLSTFNHILRTLTAALAAIAAISLSVAGVGIMNVMLVSVSERTREIGVLKALGVSSRQIVAVFLAEAMLISGSGGVLGLLLGFSAAQLFLHFQPDFPVHAPVWAIEAAVLVSIGVGLVFGGLPARRAARLDPIEALTRRRA